TDFARPAVQSYEGAVYRFVIDGELTAKLKTYLMQEQGFTLYMALLAVYHVFLSKYTGQKEIVIGSPIAGRTHADLEGILGIFINTLAMRSELDSAQTFLSFLADVKQHALDAFQNQDYPFEELVNKLNVDRDLSRNPLYSTLFAMQNMGAGQLALADVTVRALESEQENVKFDLALTAWEAGDEIACEFSYSTALFARETIGRMAGHFLRIIEQVLENRLIPLGRIELLTAEEKAQVLNEFSLNPHEGGLRASQFCIHQLFEQEADKHPDHAAVVFKDQTLTYGELNAKANQLARYLRDKGVVPEQMVGLMVNRSAEMIIAILAVLKAGGAYLPIDPDYPSERILYMLEDCEVKFLLTQQALVDAVPAACTGEVIAIDAADVYHGDGSNLPCVNKVTDLAYIIYTSGSTGKPKGVMIEHKGLCNMQSVFREQLHLNEQDRILQFATLSFDSSVLDIFMCFFSGATLVIPTKDIIASYAAFEQFMTEQEVTALCLQPSYAVNLNPDHLPKLKKMITGGAASSVEIYNKWASRVPYYNAYGPTENTILATIWHDSRYDKERTAIPIGRPLFNNGIYIVDGDNNLQPIGVPGELCVTGIDLARGYFNRPEQTAEKFVPSPFAPGEVMYRTGDLARWMPDGNIEFHGRLDDQVKIRGFRIELGEIEARMLEHDAVLEVLLTVVEESDGDKLLCAYYTTSGEITEQELRTYLGDRLPAFMVPTYLMQLDEMPMTPNKKIDRKALPHPKTRFDQEATVAQPTTETEKQLAELWAELLDVKEIGVEGDFFALGGHSLRAAKLAAQVQERFEVKLPLAMIFQYPTLGQLAAYIAEAKQQAVGRIPVLEPQEAYEVSAA
ncbi:MAG: non-ribosomal peptide synthetase, partial [Tumebacillaceae bacterium]